MNKLYPAIIPDAPKALNWFNAEKIIINDTLNDNKNFQFDDLRSPDEKLQGEIEVIDLDKIKKRFDWFNE